MNRPPFFASPILWLSSGLGLLVGFGAMASRAGEGFALALQAAYGSWGFPEMREIPEASLACLWAMILLAFAFVGALEGTPGMGRKVILMVTALLLMAMASPVMALWGFFWSPFSMLLALFWSGLGSLVLSCHQDHLERLQKEKEVPEQSDMISIEPPVFPPRHHKGP